MCNCNVRFNQLNWKVKFVKSGHPKLNDVGDSPMGITYFDKLCVYIRKTGISPNMLERVCRHEAVHMALYSYGFDGDHMKEEDIANFFECYGKEIVDNAKYMAKFAKK